jgi:hypothetical protein
MPWKHVGASPCRFESGPPHSPSKWLFVHEALSFHGGKKRKKHPKKSPQANKKEASIHDDLPQKSNFSVAVSHAFSSSWVQNSTIAFLGTLIWLVVAMATNTQIKAAAITFGLMGTAALWILAFAVIRYSSESVAVGNVAESNPCGVYDVLFGATEDSPTRSDSQTISKPHVVVGKTIPRSCTLRKLGGDRACRN